jgi:DNA-binding SARP family transcriptional activator/ABC-type branched-subunit amino acid transport system substrate-binding protein/streptogramin lyase
LVLAQAVLGSAILWSKESVVEFRILGPLSVVNGGEELVLGAAKQRTLLALLLLHRNEPVSSERLTDWLWQGEPPATAQKSLQVYVSGLRKVLRDGRLETQGRNYLLHVERGELDLDQLERLLAEARGCEPMGAAVLLEEALDLFRGDPYPELRYEQLAQAEIARLEELRLQTLERRIEAELACGRERELVAELEGLVTAHPLRERLRGQLMLALYRAGRQADALAVYRQGRELLDEQLGLEPGPELRELEQKILQHDPSLAAPPAPLAVRARRRRGMLLLVTGAGLLFAAAVAAGVVELTGSRAVGGIARVAPESVGVLDSHTGQIVDQVSSPGRPSLVVVDGRVAWVASDASHTIARVSLRGLSVGQTVVPGVTALTDLDAAGGVVWVVDDAARRRVVRISSTYGTVTNTVSLPPPLHPKQVGQIMLAVGGGTVWVTDGSTGLLRLDPRNGHVLTTVDAHVPLTDVAVGEGAVWAISGPAARVIKAGARSGKVEARIPIVARPGLTTPVPLAVTVGSGAVWVLNGNDASVTRIDPQLQAVTETIPLGAARSPNSFAAGAGAVWVANTGDGTLARIDARTNALSSIDVGSAPIGVAVAGNHVLVTVQPGSVATSTAVGSTTIASLKGALPLTFCSPVYFNGRGRPSFLVAADLPLQTPLAEDASVQISNAIRFLLARRDYKAGKYTVGFQACDDASAPDDFWQKALCRRNAHAYSRSPLLLGVIGPFNSGCVEQELPILNRGRNGPLAAISGSATTPGLTRGGPAVAKGEPTSLYPTGVRNFARVVANDSVQAAADMLLAQHLGSKRLYVLNDNFPPYGPGVAAGARQAARKLGIAVVGYRSWDYRAKRYLGLAHQIARTHADTVFLGGSFDENGDTLIRDLRTALGDRVRIIAPDGFSYPSDLVQTTGPAAEGMYISFPGVPNTRLPSAGKRFVTAFGQAIGRPIENVSVTSAQAAEVLLNAIAASNGTRASVTNHLLKATITHGILGSFAFDANGDTTAGSVTIYQIVGGKSVVRRIITPPSSLLDG